MCNYLIVIKMKPEMGTEKTLSRMESKIDKILEELLDPPHTTINDRKPFVDLLINHIADRGWVKWTIVRDNLKELYDLWDRSQPIADGKLRICQHFGVRVSREKGVKFIRYDSNQSNLYNFGEE